jgi:rhodanese-related sulfurtransferase
MRTVARDEVRELIAAGAQLVEVLPDDEYEWAHLPGAKHIPVRELAERAPKELDRGGLVITYCHDWFCDLSARGAWRLEFLGFTDVADYAGSKMDWIAWGGEFEGDADLVARHIAPVATCTPDERVIDAAARVGDDPLCVVVLPNNVVLGVLDERQFGGDTSLTAGDAAFAAPVTVRASSETKELDARMGSKRVAHQLVTDPGGHLLGVYRPAS